MYRFSPVKEIEKILYINSLGKSQNIVGRYDLNKYKLYVLKDVYLTVKMMDEISRKLHDVFVSWH